MREKLDGIERRYEELTRLISDPETIADQVKWQKLVKEHANLEEIVSTYRQYKKTDQDLEEARDMLKDKPDRELKELVEAEIKELKERKQFLEDLLKRMLLPKDPNDRRNVIMEIRAGTGGEEAALFAADLFRMYSRYAERSGWKIDVMNSNYTDIGGIKEIVFVIEGRGAYSRLKYESGVHRVQRIPTTESGGRIHTSAATVAVLPEAEEVDVQISSDEIRVDVYRSSGHGGQSVNTTDSAVRITHLPTGMVVTCQDEKSQLKNREKALRILRARLLEKNQQEQNDEIAETRRGQVGSGDRSERIRTYNFPQTRVTDHRIGLTLHRLESVLDGDIDEIINTLITSDEAERLKRAE